LQAFSGNPKPPPLKESCEHMAKDWRLENLETNPDLLGAKFVRKPYRAYRPDWEHDHCAGCWARLIEPGVEIEGEPSLHEGYAVTEEYPRGADYEWVCPSCFAEFGQDMGFVDVTPRNPD